MIVLPDNLNHEFLQILIKPFADGGIMAQVRKFTIDTANYSNIMMLDILEVLFLEYLRILNHLIV